MQGLTRPQAMWDLNDFVFDDDFVITMTSQFWTAVTEDSGTATVGVGTLNTGSVDIVTGATLNDEVYYYGLKIASLKVGCAVAMQVTLQYTEANTNECNFIFGLSKTLPSGDFLLDNNAGLNTSANYDGFYIEKLGGTTVYKAATQWSVASFSQVDTSNQSSIFTGRQVLDIEVRAFPNLVAEAVFKVFDIPSGGTPTPLTNITGIVPATIRHRFQFTGATALLPVLGVKCGSANAETVSFDRVSVFSIRA